MAESCKTHVVPFNIFTNLRYHCVKVDNDEETLWTSTTNIHKFVKKLNVLPIDEERKILAQEIY